MKKKIYSIKALSIILSILFISLSITSVSAANINKNTVSAYKTTESVSASIKTGSKGYVNASDVNLRSGPSTDYSIITCMDIYTEFIFTDGLIYNSEWYKISLDDGTVGYIYFEFASVSNSDDENTDPVYGYVNSDDVNIRSGPSTDYSILDCVDIYTELEFISVSLYNESWYHIRLNNGTEGYIHKDYASFNNEDAPNDYTGISSTSAVIYLNNPYSLSVNTTEKVSWSSSNTWVAKVTEDGMVYPVSVGSCVITAKYSDKTEQCTITVKSGENVDISNTSIALGKGKSVLLTSYDYVSWKSSDTRIATVENGIVYAKNEGKAVITAYTSYGAASCVITVNPAEAVRFVYATPNSAPLNSLVKLNAITDSERDGVYFVITNGSIEYTVEASSLMVDGKNYIWTGRVVLPESGTWTYKAYSSHNKSDRYITAEDSGEGEVFVTKTTDTTTTICAERRASSEVIELIANYEGFLPKLTPDYITDDPTIGYGKVIYSGEQFYNNLTKNEAYAYLCQTVNSGGFTSRVNDFLIDNNIKFNQQQFDSLVCFSYNVGASVIEYDDDLAGVLKDTYIGDGIIKAGMAGYVNGDGVNLRKGPSTSYNIVTVMDEHTTFTFVDGDLYNSEWYKICLSDGTEGYIYSEYASANDLQRDLNNTSKSRFLSEFLQYHHAASSCYSGLLYRRVDEAEVFFEADYIRDGEYNKSNYQFTCKYNSDFGIY